MPIRFRCVYCDKLLGIARRKAGAVVNCPHCAEKLIVPTPEPEVGAVAPSEDDLKGTGEENAYGAGEADAMKLFEQSDFDALLQSEPTFRTSETGNGPVAPEAPPVMTSAPTTPQTLQAPKNAPALAPSPFLTAEPQRPPGYFLSPSKATWLSVFVVVLLALSFGAGLIVGRMVK